LTTCENHGLERSTLTMYREHVKLHINPYLGRLKLSHLSAPLVREFEDKLLVGEPAPGSTEGKARSAAMAKKIRTSLGSLTAEAQERGLVNRNVVRELRAGRKRGGERRADRRQNGKLKVGVDIPTPPEMSTFLAALRGRWKPVLLTAVFTGLRASELRGLRWDDVDLLKRELHVRQRADRYNKIGPPKSESGGAHRAAHLVRGERAQRAEAGLEDEGWSGVPQREGKADSTTNIVEFA
jgi:integrase